MKAAPVTAVVPALVSVIVSTDGEPAATEVGAKAFVTAGCGNAVRVADPPAAVPALPVVTLPVLLA